MRSSRPEELCKKVVLRNFIKLTGMQHQACNFIKKETLAQVFSCKFCEISKKTFFYRTPLVAASDMCHMNMLIRSITNVTRYVHRKEIYAQS